MTLRSFFFYWSYCLIHTMISFMMNLEKRVIEMKLKEGQKVYYLIGGFVESGHVIDLEKKPYGFPASGPPPPGGMRRSPHALFQWSFCWPQDRSEDQRQDPLHERRKGQDLSRSQADYTGTLVCHQ